MGDLPEMLTNKGFLIAAGFPAPKALGRPQPVLGEAEATEATEATLHPLPKVTGTWRQRTQGPGYMEEAARWGGGTRGPGLVGAGALPVQPTI